MACTRRGIVTLVALIWFYDIVGCFLRDFYICTIYNKVTIFHLFHCLCALAKWLLQTESTLSFTFGLLVLSFPSHTFTFLLTPQSVGRSSLTNLIPLIQSLKAFPHPDQKSLMFPRNALLDVYRRQYWESETAFQMIFAICVGTVIDQLKFGQHYEIWLKFRNFEIWTTLGNLLKILK